MLGPSTCQEYESQEAKAAMPGSEVRCAVIVLVVDHDQASQRDQRQPEVRLPRLVLGQTLAFALWIVERRCLERDDSCKDRNQMYGLLGSSGWEREFAFTSDEADDRQSLKRRVICEVAEALGVVGEYERPGEHGECLLGGQKDFESDSQQRTLAL